MSVTTFTLTNSRLNNNTVAAPTAITTDIDIVPVKQIIDPSNPTYKDVQNYVYDGQTILMINSTLNPNANIAKAQYFDPVNGQPGRYSSSGLNFGEWNFNTVPTNYLNGVMSSSSLLSETTSLYNNLQTVSVENQYSQNMSMISTGQYELDIANGGALTSQSGEPGTSYETMFFSLTSQPYMTFKGDFVFPSGSSQTEPNYNNVNPGYSGNNSDSFIFTSNYYTQQKNEILIVQLVFTVSNTNALNVQSMPATGSTSNIPSISVVVYNKVISQDNLASLSTNNNSKVRVTQQGPIPLQFMQNGSIYNPNTANYSINNNVPIIFADGYTKVFATFPVIYVPPAEPVFGSYYGQYLNNGNSVATSYGPNPGYLIENNLPTVPANNVDKYPINSTQVSGSNQVIFGHFVVGIAYSTDLASYNPGTYILSEILIKNIWRSPISIYNSYQAFSVYDLSTKLVVLLFGSVGGSLYLVTNTGTPFSSISSFAVTSLRNFMNIMTAIVTTYDGSIPIADYFISNKIIQLYNLNYQPVTLQPLLDGNIINPPTVALYPNMYYLFLNKVNTQNLSIDPSNQSVINYRMPQPYFGLSNSRLCSAGYAAYYNSSLTMLSTSNNNISKISYLFGNSLFQNTIMVNKQFFDVLLILPEALFNGVPSSMAPNVFSIYSTSDSLFYLSANSSSFSQFSADSYHISNTGTTTVNRVTTTVTPNLNISKIVLSVSNVLLF
jgi:hypothetical protein